MTLLSKNTLSIEELQQLIPSETERDLIRFSIIDPANNKYQFNHNLFQEYYAALFLKQKSLAEIKNIIAFKPTLDKIKNKWINPLSFLISMLDDRNDVLINLCNWLIDIEPEVLLNMEAEKFETQVRFDIVMKIFRYYKELDIRIPYNLFREPDAGSFIGYNIKFLNYCLAEINSSISTDTTKTDYIYYLQKFDNFFGKENEVEKTLLNAAVNNTHNTYIQEVAIATIERLKGFLNIENCLQFILKNCTNQSVLKVRLEICDLMIVTTYKNFYLDYAFETIPILDSNGEIRTMGENIVLNDIMLKSKKYEDVIKVLNKIIENTKWIDRHYSERFELEDTFVSIFTANCIEAYKENKNILLPYLLLIEKLSNEYALKEHISTLIVFFEQTNTIDLAFEHFFNKAKTTENNEWNFIRCAAQFAKKNKLLAIYKEYESGLLTKDLVWRLRSNLQDAYTQPIHNWFHKYINKKSENDFLYSNEHKLNIDYKKLREKQQTNNQKLLTSRTKFFKELKLVFDKANVDFVTLKMFHTEMIECFDNLELKPNTIIYDTIRAKSIEYGKINYQTIFNSIHPQAQWESFVLKETFDILQKNELINTALQEIVTNYLINKIQKFDFKKAIIETERNGFSTSHLCQWLPKFSFAFDLKFDDTTLLNFIYTDYHSFYDIDGTSVKHRMADFVINNISNKELLVETTLQNIKHQNLNSTILGTHFYLCQKLKIYQAKNEIHKALIGDQFEQTSKMKIVDIYTFLGGNIVDLLDYYMKIENYDYWFFDLSDKLITEEKIDVSTKLEGIVDNEGINEEIKKSACLCLIKQGNLKALKYFCNYVVVNKSSLFEYHFWQSANQNISFPVDESLSLLFKALVIAFEANKLSYKGFHFDSLDEPIYALINHIGVQSEDNYLKALNCYSNFKNEFIEQYPLVKNIYYPVKNMKNLFYKNKEEQISIDEIAELI